MTSMMISTLRAIRGRLENLEQREKSGEGFVAFGLGLSVLLGGWFVYLHMQWVECQNFWHAVSVMGSNVMLMFFWGFIIAIGWLTLLVLMRDYLLDRIRDLARGYKVGRNPAAETCWFGIFTIIFVILAYNLDGRLNAFFAGGEWEGMVIYYLITFMLYFPAFASAFVAATAYKVHSFPEQTWN